MKILYSGKTKDVVLDEEKNVVNLFFKDTATGENGVFDPGSNSVGGSVEGKGQIGLKLSKYFFELMEKNGIPTQYLGSDIEKSGELHEYYHPETGEPIMNPGFQNWNLLSINMGEWLNGNNPVCEF